MATPSIRGYESHLGSVSPSWWDYQEQQRRQFKRSVADFINDRETYIESLVMNFDPDHPKDEWVPVTITIEILAPPQTIPDIKSF